LSLLTDWRDSVVADQRLDTTATAVALVLSTYMSADGVAWPSRETIGAGAKLKSVRSVDRAIAILECAGWLSIERSKGRRSHRYRATAQPAARLISRNGASHDTSTVHLTTPTAQPTAPEGFESEDESTERLTPNEIQELLMAHGLASRPLKSVAS
jgi:hypothetical protein